LHYQPFSGDEYIREMTPEEEREFLPELKTATQKAMEILVDEYGFKLQDFGEAEIWIYFYVPPTEEELEGYELWLELGVLTPYRAEFYFPHRPAKEVWLE
jgi:hypothetical protein